MDPLRTVKTQFYCGNWQTAINHANSLPVAADATQPKLSFIYRSYLAQKKYSLLLSDIPSTTPLVVHKVIRLTALYHQANEEERLTLADEASLAVSESDGRDAMAAVCLAELLLLDGQVDEAMQACHPHASTDLECMAMMVQLLLKINRTDLAQKQLEKMRTVSEDATLTQLAEAWVSLSAVPANAKQYQQAYYVFQELQETAGVTCRLSNNMAVCQMHMGKYDEAEKTLLEALNKVHDDPDCLANLVACSCHLGRPIDVAERYYKQLKDSSAGHVYAVDVDAKEAQFDRLQAMFA